jgi:hypothetical protein
MAADFKGARQGLVIPWRQSHPSNPLAQSAGTAQCPFTSVGLPIDYLEALEASRPAVYAEFQPFQELWSRDRVTQDHFHAFVRLMHRTGDIAEAEHFLCSNLLVSADDGLSWFLDDAGLNLYTELFGTAKREEFAAAVAAFEVQFSARLTKGAGGGFMVEFETRPRAAALGPYLLRGEPCAVRFEYESKDSIEAQLWNLKSEDQLLFLRWVKGIWEILGTGYGTRVSKGE